MATFDFSVVGWFARSDQPVLDIQAFEPEAEGAGKTIFPRRRQTGFPVSLHDIGQSMPVCKGSTKGGTHLFHGNPSCKHLCQLGPIQDGCNANFPNRIPHRMQVNECSIPQGNSHLEVNLPAFMYL